MTLSPKRVASFFSVLCHHKIQCSRQRAPFFSDSRNVAVESYEAMAKLRLLVCLFVSHLLKNVKCFGDGGNSPNREVGRQLALQFWSASSVVELLQPLV